uniref:Pyroglutamyl-peptidase 1-like n=2 Tax=Dermatophagoides pteronyssinus TaxID=6956 RepID=A0A6P6XUN8_DERPT|nr:pyroglutamyl-peptidase 1-like [Dermatophagoides pteronyssinus]
MIIIPEEPNRVLSFVYKLEKTEIMEPKKKENVILTGFGLFRAYKINPSWEAVQLIDECQFGSNIEIIKIQIPVAYNEVERIVEEIWTKYQPKLVIHCGVSCVARCLHLEKRAVTNKERYCQPDIFSCLPKRCSNNDPLKPDYIYTDLNLETIRDEINQHYYDGNIEIPAKISDCAGEFLCEYIYHCSLQYDCRRTLFIHVPDINQELSIKDLSKCIELVIHSALKQLPPFIHQQTKTTN